MGGYSEKQIETLIEAIYAGVIRADRLPVDLYEAILVHLEEAALSGFGTVAAGDTGRAVMLTKLPPESDRVLGRQNGDSDPRDERPSSRTAGKLRPFTDFRSLARGIFAEFNEQWLRTEFDTAYGQSQMAARWADIKENREGLPLLRYVTVGDARVRDEHAALDGMTKPVDDPVWDTYYPPNGWNCRCTVEQLPAGEITPGRPDAAELPPELFRMNSGKDGIIFKDDHPYFLGSAGRYEVNLQSNYGLPVPEGV